MRFLFEFGHETNYPNSNSRGAEVREQNRAPHSFGDPPDTSGDYSEGNEIG